MTKNLDWTHLQMLDLDHIFIVGGYSQGHAAVLMSQFQLTGPKMVKNLRLFYHFS